MTKRALVIVVVAALALGGAAAVIASSISANDEPVHTLPGGGVHTGEMPQTGTSGDSTGGTPNGRGQDGATQTGGQSEHDMGNMDGMDMGE